MYSPRCLHPLNVTEIYGHWGINLSEYDLVLSDTRTENKNNREYILREECRFFEAGEGVKVGMPAARIYH